MTRAELELAGWTGVVVGRGVMYAGMDGGSGVLWGAWDLNSSSSFLLVVRRDFPFYVRVVYCCWASWLKRQWSVLAITVLCPKASRVFTLLFYIWFPYYIRARTVPPDREVKRTLVLTFGNR
ncbi:hypothetical protein E2C01_008346 [Portunus trituberculatus]|uniref:Uncharacterized protein n=1 Tax=Portunus trituberculatus TaxID=210409 RepID=A0A5B7D1M1_PORTR|nr:hypothetical protein [Portunus trituberculatus]